MMADTFINDTKSMGHIVNKYEAAFMKISETALLICGDFDNYEVYVEL